MSELNKGCIVAISPCCNRVVFVTVNEERSLDTEMFKTIGECVKDGCRIEHQSVEWVRKSRFGCKCNEKGRE